MSVFLDNAVRRMFQNPCAILREYIHPGDTVIDIGCGPGFFSLDMARLVGETGKVHSVDLQPEMLRIIEKKARKHSLSDRIILHQCGSHTLNLNNSLQADFILAYYMVHETPDHPLFFSEVRKLLKPGGRFLVVEPKFHVSRAHFAAIIADAEAAGFRPLDTPEKKGGRAVLLTV